MMTVTSKTAWWAMIVPLLSVALAACQSEEGSNGPRPGMESNPLLDPPICNQDMMQEWVGQDVGLFDPMPGIETRIVGPRDPVSTDYLPNRVTFVVDESGVITRADCG